MKYIFSSVLTALYVLSTMAEPSISVGLGANYSTISGGDTYVTKNSPRAGLNVKLGLEQNFSKHFTLATGVSFETRGEKNESFHKYDSSFSEETTGEIDILNLQIPLLAQFNLPFSIFSLNIFAGPELGVFLASEARNDITSRFAATDTDPARSAVKHDTIDFSKKMNTAEFGINGGLNFEIKTGDAGAFFIKPGVYIGMSNILKKDLDNDTTANLSGKHSTIYCTIGYRFNVKPKKAAIEKDADSKDIDNEDAVRQTEPAASSPYQSSPDNYKNYDSQDSDSSSSGSESMGTDSPDSDTESESTP